MVNNMTKVKANAAEIVITVITILILTLSSCGSTHYVCPSYAGVTEAEVGPMYANQQWDKEQYKTNTN